MEDNFVGLNDLKRLLNKSKINEASTLKVSFNLTDLENVVLKFETGVLPVERLIEFLRKEMDEALEKRQVKDNHKTREDQKLAEGMKTHARILFADAFETLGYDANDSSIVSMVENLTIHFIKLKVKYKDADDTTTATSAIEATWHASSNEWREVLDRLKATFEGEVTNVE